MQFPVKYGTVQNEKANEQKIAVNCRNFLGNKVYNFLQT